MLFLQMIIFGSPVNLNRGKSEKITCLRVVDVQKKDRMKQNTLMVDEIND